MQTAHRPIAAYGLLSLLALLALAMRLAQVGESLWVDELHTAWTVAEGIEQVAPRAMLGNQSPLYFYLVWAATRVFGFEEFTLRLPSLTAGVALVPLAYWLVRRWTGSTTAALAAALVAAVDRDFLFYATEARAYALVQAAALVRLAVFARLLTAPSVRMRIAYVALAAIMFHLHYTSALLWAGEAACVAAAGFVRRRDDYRIRWFLADSLLLLVACLPAAPHLRDVYERRENWAAFVARPAMEEAFLHRLARRALPLGAYLLPPGLVLAAASVWRIRRDVADPDDRQKTAWRGAAVLTLWLATPILVALLLSATDQARVFLYRYLIGSATVVPVLAGVLCGLGPTRRWRIAAASATALAATILLAPDYAAQFRRDGRLIADRNEDWRSAVEFINAQDGRRPAFIDAGLIECETFAASNDPLKRAFCLLPVAGLYRIDADDRIVAPLSNESLREHAKTAVQQGGVWVALRAPPRYADARIRAVKQILDREGDDFQVDETQRFGLITVARLSVGSDRPIDAVGQSIFASPKSKTLKVPSGGRNLQIGPAGPATVRRRLFSACFAFTNSR